MTTPNGKLAPTAAGSFALSVVSDLFSFGMSWEEPEEVVGESFGVLAEGIHGERFAHFKSFRRMHSCQQAGCNEDGPGFGSRYVCPQHAAQEFKSDGAARKAAEALLARIQAAQTAGTWKGPVNNPHWHEVQAAYGSEAYEAGGWESFNAEMERKENGR